MSEEVGLHGDVLEKILAISDVEDLLRCKAVCKSWLSLICDPLFIKTHLMHSRNKDRKNDKTRRIIMAWFADDRQVTWSIVGSSNGLICLLTGGDKQILILNPSIRRLRQELLMWPIIARDARFLCTGFGYDFITDDYKVVLGDYTCFQVLSLKSSVWKVIKVGYKFLSKVGVLCNGALHWFMQDHNENIVIVAFDLSTEEFKEIPQPDDSSYESYWKHGLGSMNECLCIYSNIGIGRTKLWVMNNYNVKQSWEMLPDNFKPKSQFIHLFEPENDNNPCDPKCQLIQNISETNFICDVCDPVFVQTLVSPHFIGNQ